MVMENWCWRTDKFMRVNFNKDKNMEMVITNGQLGTFTVVISLRTRDKDLEFINGMRVDITKGNGVEIE